MSLNRRGFLLGSVSLATVGSAGTAIAADASRPLPPPGADSTAALLRRCTACGLCLSRCPSKVLRAADLEYGLGGLMMPRMDFSHGYCRPDCTDCGRVCPAGALRPFTPAEKAARRLAVAVYDRQACLVTKEKFACGNCATHCPYQAIAREKDADGRLYPKVDATKCAGCGACEYHCPVKAIRVVGREARS